MKEIGELEIISNIKRDTLNDSEKNQLDEVIALFSEMNVTEIEPLLDEKINGDKVDQNNLSKYQVLAIIRDIFLDYKKSGDTSILIEIGKCKGNCYPGSVFNLQGNNSKKNFSFIINKNNGLIKEIHYCSLFSTNDNQQRKPDTQMYINTLKKQAEFQGEPTDRYDKENYKEAIESAFEIAWRNM